MNPAENIPGTYISMVVLAELGERQWLIPLQRDPITIGRSINNIISVQDSQVAPRHLKIIPLGEEIWARDAGSPEGFYWNKNLVREVQLKPGDEISVGGVKVSLLIEKKEDPVALVEMDRSLDFTSRAQRRRQELGPGQRYAWARNPWVWVSSASILLLFLLMTQTGQDTEIQDRQAASLRALERAGQLLEEGKWEEVPLALEEVSPEDAILSERARKMEIEAARLIRDRERVLSAARGDEFWDRYLRPLFRSQKLHTDIRWEFILWRRCAEFLDRFPSHSKAALVQARQNRISRGTDVPPQPSLAEVELEVGDLITSKPPNFTRARAVLLAFIRANTGTTEDLQARETLKNVDGQAVRYFELMKGQIQLQVDAGELDQARQALEQLREEIGVEKLAAEAKRWLESLEKP